MKIIKIGAIWCPGCLIMKKIWKNITDIYNDLDIIDFDYDVDSMEISKYNPGKVLPVVIFLDDKGNELERLIGEQKEKDILERIEKYT